MLKGRRQVPRRLLESQQQPAPAPQWITGVTIDLDRLRSTALALMEQQTGLALDREWLNEKRPTYRIPDPDVMLKDVENARLP